MGVKKKKSSKQKVTKVASSLISKWQAVRRDLVAQEQEEEEAEDPDPVVQQRRKQKELEQWRAQQLAAGAAEENANFAVCAFVSGPCTEGAGIEQANMAGL